MIRIVDSSKMTKLASTSIPSNIIDILDLKTDDEILWIFNENRNIIVRKSSGIRPSFKELKPEERFIAKNVAMQVPETSKEWRTHIPKEVRETLGLNMDRILWALDGSANVIVMNSVLSNDCTKDVIGSDSPAMVTYVTPISGEGITTFPKEIRESLDIGHGDVVILNDMNGNMVVTKSPMSSVYYHTKIMGKKANTFYIYLEKQIKHRLKVDIGDSILWIIDERKNIIIRNSFLPNICTRPSKFVRA